MAYQKRYRTIVPVEHGLDPDVARWLARESFENRATSDGVQLIDYSEREVSVEEIPPKVLKQLGRPLTDFAWLEFTGTGKLDKDLFDWLSAEYAWTNDQIRAWLAAENRSKLSRA